MFKIRHIRLFAIKILSAYISINEKRLKIKWYYLAFDNQSMWFIKIRNTLYTTFTIFLLLMIKLSVLANITVLF